MTVYLGLETPIWQVRGPRGLMPRVAAGGREAIRISESLQNFQKLSKYLISVLKPVLLKPKL